MSWSVSAVGKPIAVAQKLTEEFGRSKCAEPEETIKSMVADIAAKALASFAPDIAVRINASGSQYADNGIVKYNQLKIEIEPLWGFIE